MTAYTDLVNRLVRELAKLPGIGPRSAERIVFHILKVDSEYARNLASLLVQVKQHSFFCKECHHLSESEICHICRDPGRDQKIICVVEESKDIIALEKTGAHKGLYHVLLGALSPLDGIGPRELRIQDLLRRIREKNIREVILATNSNTEGETTALYLLKILKPLGVSVTRIAKGIPVGSNLEFADQATLGQALTARVPFA
ncbi:MAG TPA: recombination mediator RecR [Candidatus Omnitrophota bacterium]|nr:recombination mediator RecR [Candidatus Omnitrophota bacterium]